MQNISRVDGDVFSHKNSLNVFKCLVHRGLIFCQLVSAMVWRQRNEKFRGRLGVHNRSYSVLITLHFWNCKHFEYLIVNHIRILLNFQLTFVVLSVTLTETASSTLLYLHWCDWSYYKVHKITVVSINIARLCPQFFSSFEREFLITHCHSSGSSV